MFVKRRKNIRVQVEPKIAKPGSLFDRVPQEYQPKMTPELEAEYYGYAQSLQILINRHLFDEDFAAYVMYETVIECEFCADSEDYGDSIPWCCDDAQMEWMRANPYIENRYIAPSEDHPMLDDLRNRIALEDAA